MSLEKLRADARRWLAQARADLKAARASTQAGCHEWAAFQGQQAGEKALKALWFWHGGDPWGHSIVRLVRAFPDPALRAAMRTLLSAAQALDKLYIPTRYPNGLPDLIPAEVFTRAEARAAITQARTLIVFVARHLRGR